MQKKILIVEDEKPLRHALVDKFSMEDFEVFEAVNGQEGLDMALEKKPDCILLDVMMPVMDGMEMLKELRKDTWGATAPVIFLTNVNESEKIAEAIEGQVYNYFVKTDWKLEDIVENVKNRLEKIH